MEPDGSLAKPRVYADPKTLLIGGLMIQFGTAVVTPSSFIITVPFPKAFANADVTVVAIFGDFTTSQLVINRPAMTNKAFTAWVSVSSNVRIEWIAIGQAP